VIVTKETESPSIPAIVTQSDQECLTQNGAIRIIHVQHLQNSGAYFVYIGATMAAFTDEQWAQFRGMVNSA
jgi:hypothetical protein